LKTETNRLFDDLNRRNWRGRLPRYRVVRLELLPGRATITGVCRHRTRTTLVKRELSGDRPEDPVTGILDVSKVFAENCPLWTYILAEATQHREAVRIPVKEHVTINTPKLGPVGGRIVAEVFLGLLFGDRNSLLNQDPDWPPK
jgi:hypothetical protein